MGNAFDNVDENYVCDPQIAQQVIDYYAEVTPQCGEAISWVWFSIDGPEVMKGGRENRYFGNYLSNFKDKFYLEFGLPKVQSKVDKADYEFLHQYEKRGKFECGPGFIGKCAASAARPSAEKPTSRRSVIQSPS